MGVALVYLARGEGDGLAKALRFVAAYDAFDAGCAHRLVVACKGWRVADERDRLAGEIARRGGTCIDLPDNGLDWGAYFRVAGELEETTLCFLNSHSRPLGPEWLAAITQPVNSGAAVAAGATGSWGTHRPVRLRPEPPETVADVAKYGPRWVKNVILDRHLADDFPPFPNPHLRSNGFAVRRDAFLAFARTVPFPRVKRDAHRLEGGLAGFTRRIVDAGGTVVVAATGGRTFPPDQWIESATFRVPGQPGLLVADNQTDAYAQAPDRMKRVMELAAWGRVFTHSRRGAA